ncbi:MAG: preprotein translocase subunit SecG [Phycisphaerales bacterium]|nr:preprotein translocase subunit SecG [Phycisphaerales bacterium]
MTSTYMILTAIFIIVAVALILIILVQRPAGGGLAGAFGGAGGGGTESVFGGRVGDALTVMTVIGFCVYLGLAITLNLMESRDVPVVTPTVQQTLDPLGGTDPPLPGGSTGTTSGADSTGGATSTGTTTPPANEPAADGVFTPLPPETPADGAATPESPAGEGN